MYIEIYMYIHICIYMYIQMMYDIMSILVHCIWHQKRNCMLFSHFNDYT